MSRRLDVILSHISGASQESARRATDLTPHTTAAAAGSGEAPTNLDFVKFEKVGRVGVITLNRPKELNAINDRLIQDVGTAIRYCNTLEANIGCIVLTGAGRAFAAGADIKEMKDKNYYQMSTVDKIAPWEEIAKSKIPIISAVNGFAFGGGCEIAMMTDIIYASDTAVFGQPEIKLGTIPGAGGTQRLTRAIGKAKAMELVLTGRNMKATEAEKAGLVAAVLPPDQLLPHAMKAAGEIANMSTPVVKLAKEAVNSAFETTLDQGNHIERRLFHSTFALKDQKIGMHAFANKQKATFEHQ